jgi:hypothetical protein
MTSLSLAHPAPGIATVGFGSSGRGLTYRSEAQTHRITVHDDFGRMQFGFGGRGRGPTMLDTPLDVTCVDPAFPGEHLPIGSPFAVWLAVADYGNRRVQVYELDGVHVGTIMLTDHPAVVAPVRLRWSNPVLHIEGVEGARTSVYVTAALLHDAAGTVSRLPREWRPCSQRVN